MGDSGDSVTGPAGLGDSGPVVLDGMRVLRLCSVFEPAALSEQVGGLRRHRRDARTIPPS